MRRLPTVVLAVAAVLVSCASTSIGTNPMQEESRARAAVQVPARTPTGVVQTAAPFAIPTSSRHSAFPGLAQAPGGSLTLVWRGGTDHYLARDGQIKMSTSSDLGRTWTPETTVLSGRDYRDPSIAYVGGHQFLTYFTGSAANFAEGAMVSRDGASAVRIDTLPYAAISAPVVQLPDGRLGVAFYGKKAGETYDTAWIGWSSNGGLSWTTNRIINSGIATPEPVLVVDGSLTHMFTRWGADKIAMRTSADSGATWGPVRVIIDGCTGRPSTTRTASGVLILVCRGPISQGKHALELHSTDHGGFWAVGPRILPAPAGSPNGMTYAAFAQVLPGVTLTVFGMEQADGSSSLYGAYLAESTT